MQQAKELQGASGIARKTLNPSASAKLTKQDSAIPTILTPTPVATTTSNLNLKETLQNVV
jgi:hypothetical protein